MARIPEAKPGSLQGGLSRADTGPRVCSKEEWKSRPVGKRGRGLLRSFERHWEEVRNTERTNGASQQHFRNANLVAASTTHYRGEMQSRGNYLG